MAVRSFSYGGGQQSTAALVLAARGEIDYPLFCFANTGDDSENPETLEYVREIAAPYARMNGIELVQLQRTMRGGETDTLMGKITRRPKSVPIPVRMGARGAPASRSCTADFKIRVIEKELRRRGATEEQKATVGIGISLDEFQRMGSEIDPLSDVQLRRYPLIDLRLTRDDCQQIIRSEGLPVPPPSSCYFCPFHSAHEWRRLARNQPDLFEKACQLEEEMQRRAARLGRGEFFMTPQGIPLRELYGGAVNELPLFEDDALGLADATCDTGHCMI